MPRRKGSLSGIDLVAWEAIAHAPSDPDRAAEALRRAAEYIEAGEPLPVELAGYLAGAIRASMDLPAGERERAFLEALHLKARGRRPAAYWLDVGFEVAGELHAGGRQNLTGAAIAVADRRKISPKTAELYYRQYLEAVKAHDAASRED